MALGTLKLERSVKENGKELHSKRITHLSSGSLWSNIVGNKTEIHRVSQFLGVANSVTNHILFGRLLLLLGSPSLPLMSNSL